MYNNKYGFLPAPLYDTAELFSGVNFTNEMQLYSSVEKEGGDSWRESYQSLVFNGPVDWLGLRVVSARPGHCPVPQGRNQDCQATLLCNTRTLLTSENCYDGVDNDMDGLVDKADPDCQRCGDETTDPEEECDDGNILDGDGCTSICTLPPPPSPPPTPPSPSPPSPSPRPPRPPPTTFPDALTTQFAAATNAVTADAPAITPAKSSPSPPTSTTSVAGPLGSLAPANTSTSIVSITPIPTIAPPSSIRPSPVPLRANVRIVAQYIKLSLSFQGSSPYFMM
ncbi:hypothetical protein Vretimale_12181 [Volvox reticuliferus]|nr:hypothetical protein Vretimale_12181 [Volvox reticuliferus]